MAVFADLEDINRDRAALGLKLLITPEEAVARQEIDDLGHLRMVLGLQRGVPLVARGWGDISDAERSRNAKRQLRGKDGRFINMGGKVAYKGKDGNERAGRFAGVNDAGRALVEDAETKQIEEVDVKDVRGIQAKAELKPAAPAAPSGAPKSALKIPKPTDLPKPKQQVEAEKKGKAGAAPPSRWPVQAYPDAKRDAEGRMMIPLDELPMFTRPGTTHYMTPHIIESVDPETGEKMMVLSREREELHNELVSKTLEGIRPPEGRGPEHIFLGGGPGSGKSSVARHLGLPQTRELGHYDDKPPGQAALCEADGFKLALPDYDKDDVDASTYSHSESTMINRAAHSAAARAGVDTVIDGTGDGKVEHQQENLAKVPKGGTSRAVYVTIPTSEALVRSMDRAVKIHREVPADGLMQSHGKVSYVGPAMKDDYGTFELYDTDTPRGAEPLPIYVDGKIVDQQKWDAFVGKQQEDPVEQILLALKRANDASRKWEGTDEMSADQVRTQTINKLLGALKEAKAAEKKKTG